MLLLPLIKQRESNVFKKFTLAFHANARRYRPHTLGKLRCRFRSPLSLTLSIVLGISFKCCRFFYQITPLKGLTQKCLLHQIQDFTASNNKRAVECNAQTKAVPNEDEGCARPPSSAQPSAPLFRSVNGKPTAHPNSPTRWTRFRVLSDSSSCCSILRQALVAFGFTFYDHKYVMFLRVDC